MLSCFDSKIVASIFKIYYDVGGAMSEIGTRSGLEDSSLNNIHSCAPLLFVEGDLMSDIEYMNLAYDQALLAYAINEVPVGAIIVYRDQIIARAYNQKDSLNCVTKHAEILALEEASRFLNNWRLNECRMYVTLEPCPMCASAIQQARIDTVYYGTSAVNKDNKDIVDKIFNSVNANQKVCLKGPILSDQCTALLQEFFLHIRNQ